MSSRVLYLDFACFTFELLLDLDEDFNDVALCISASVLAILVPIRNLMSVLWILETAVSEVANTSATSALQSVPNWTALLRVPEFSAVPALKLFIRKSSRG